MKGVDTVFFVLAIILLLFLFILVIFKLATQNNNNNSSSPTIINRVIEMPRTVYRSGYDLFDRRLIRPVRRFTSNYF